MSPRAKSSSPPFAEPDMLDEPHALDRWIERWGEVFGHDETPGRVPIFATQAERAANARMLARIHARGLLYRQLIHATMLGPEPGTDQAIWQLPWIAPPDGQARALGEPPPLVVVTRAGLVKTVLPRGTLFKPLRRTR